LLALVSFTFFVLDFSDRHIIFNHLDGLRKIIFPKDTLFIDDEVNSVGTCRVKVVLKRGRSEVCIHYVTRLILNLDYPFTELACVWNRG
jgi:hypothetical protein